MANYYATVASNTFKVKKEEIDNVRRAISFYEESYVDDNGETFIGSYEETLSDDLCVLYDSRTHKVIASFDAGYESIETAIEENCDTIEDFLEQANIKSEEEYDVNDFSEIDFAEYIQSVLEEGEYAFIKEVGNEKLRYVAGCGVLITKKSITWIDLDRVAQGILEKENDLAQ